MNWLDKTEDEQSDILVLEGHDPPQPGGECPACYSSRTYFSCLFGKRHCLSCGLRYSLEDIQPAGTQEQLTEYQQMVKDNHTAEQEAADWDRIAMEMEKW